MLVLSKKSPGLTLVLALPEIISVSSWSSGKSIAFGVVISRFPEKLNPLTGLSPITAETTLAAVNSVGRKSTI